METSQKDKVEVLSIIGDEEKSWTIDRYHLTVGISIISVVIVMAGIFWLASGGGGNTLAASVLPTGKLEFNSNNKPQNKSVSVNDLPYPEVRSAQPLAPGKSSSVPSKAPTPTATSHSDAPTATPTPTNTPKAPDPTATPTPAPTVTPTVSPVPTTDLTPTP